MRDFKSLILDLVTEDYHGLWELIWSANTVEPGQNQQTLVADLRSALESLIREGEVALYRGSSFNGEERRVSNADIPKELRVEANWPPPPIDVPHLRVLSESLGRTGTKQ
jgi:hypothetical protein